MRIKATFFVSLILSLHLSPALLFAKAAYYRKTEMIRMADAIALVTIKSVDSTAVKGGTWTYREVASAQVEMVLKGTLANEIKLYGGEDFICAQCHYTEGRFLVFLKRDGHLLTGVNWHLSIRPINGETIEWYRNDDSIELETKPLREVFFEVEALVKKNAGGGGEQTHG